MAEVRYDDLKRLDLDLAAALGAIPGLRREAHTQIATAMQSAVRGRIGGTGKVQGWQGQFVGTGGGYAAVRPLAKTYDKYGRAVGYITNAIERGHKIRPPGTSARYRPRIKKYTVPGKFMYANTIPETEALAADVARELLDRVADKMEGK